jgi:hypothetical protein
MLVWQCGTKPRFSTLEEVASPLILINHALCARCRNKKPSFADSGGARWHKFFRLIASTYSIFLLHQLILLFGQSLTGHSPFLLVLLLAAFAL